MRARLWKFLADLGETFWLLPAVLVLLGIALAQGLVAVDRRYAIPHVADWFYSGGGTGARTLLGAIATSVIGVAGTVFSVTIAALTLASSQMGPRLLRNFTRDRGNQATLGIFLGTFSYALVVLRTVRDQSEGGFIPHVALTVSIGLAIICVGMLVYFVHHVATRINVDTVIDLVHDELLEAIERLTLDASPAEPPPLPDFDGEMLTDDRNGYLQQLDEDGLAGWAATRDATVRLLVRPGDYVYPHAPIAVVSTGCGDAAAAIRDATALGSRPARSSDLENPVRRLQEVAVRALSPGVNDPNTAMTVLQRMGAVLCTLSRRDLPTGILQRDGRVVLMRPVTDYDGLTDTMFHMIRQNAADSAAVTITLLEVLAAVACCEHRPERRAALRRHGELALDDAARAVRNAADLADIRARHRRLVRNLGG